MNTFTKAITAAGFASFISLSTTQFASAVSADMTEAPAAPTLQSGGCGTLGPPAVTPAASMPVSQDSAVQKQTQANGGIGPSPDSYSPYSGGGTNGTIGPRLMSGDAGGTIGPQGPCPNETVIVELNKAKLVSEKTFVEQFSELKGKVANGVIAFVQSIQQRSQEGKAIIAPQGYVVSTPTAMPMTPMPLLP